MASNESTTNSPSAQSSAPESELRSHAHSLLQYLDEEDVLALQDLSLLEGRVIEPDLVIECGDASWKVHREIVLSRSAYLRRRDNANNNQPCLKLNDFDINHSRMDLYILWLYSQNFVILSRWIEQQWPDDDMEGILEALAWASHVEQEDKLFAHAKQAVQDHFATKIWVLANEGILEPADRGKARRSVDACLEALFEQETKTIELSELRADIMLEMFKKADQLLPRHQWLNQWIGRSPAFKAEFLGTKKDLLRSKMITRRPGTDGELDHNDNSDDELESFDYIWTGGNGNEISPASSAAGTADTKPDASVAKWLQDAQAEDSAFLQWRAPTPPRGRPSDPVAEQTRTPSQSPVGKKVTFREPPRGPLQEPIWESWEEYRLSPDSRSQGITGVSFGITANDDEPVPTRWEQGGGAHEDTELEDDDLYGR